MLLKGAKQLSRTLTRALKRKLEQQGHIATVNLRNSVEIAVKPEFNALVLEETNLDYGDFVNTGRAAGKKGVPVMALKDWVEVKHIATGKKALSIAYAIQKTIIREGIPTRKSRSRGKKTGWIDDTLKEQAQTIERVIFAATGQELETMIDQLATKVQNDAIAINRT